MAIPQCARQWRPLPSISSLVSLGSSRVRGAARTLTGGEASDAFYLRNGIVRGGELRRRGCWKLTRSKARAGTPKKGPAGLGQKSAKMAHRGLFMAGASDAKIEQLGDERKGLPSPTISSFVEDSMDDAPGALRLNNVAKETLISLTRSMFRYSRAYQALFFYHVFDAALQLWQSFYPESLPLVTESEYSLVLNSTALVNYWLCYYFLDTCGRAFVTITEEKEDSLPEVLKGVVYLTLTCNELTVVAWLFTLALTIEASMLWDGTKYFVGALIYIFALVRVYGYFLINKYYGQLQGFVSEVLRDKRAPVRADMNISKAEQVLLKVDDNNDGGFRFSDDDLDLFRSLATAMFTTGVSYLVATSCTAVYYGAAVAVGDDAEVVSALYSVPEYLSQFLTGVLLLETTDSFVSLVNGRPYISQYIKACGKLDNVFVGLTNVTVGVILGDLFDLFWGGEFTSDIAVSFDLAILNDVLTGIVQ